MTLNSYVLQTYVVIYVHSAFSYWDRRNITITDLLMKTNQHFQPAYFGLIFFSSYCTDCELKPIHFERRKCGAEKADGETSLSWEHARRDSKHRRQRTCPAEEETGIGNRRVGGAKPSRGAQHPIEMAANTSRGNRYRKQRSISHMTYSNYGQPLNELAEHLPPVFASSNGIESDEFQLLSTQVAGHKFVEGKDSIGMLKSKDGSILKPINKPESGVREIFFYQKLQTTADPILIELRDYCAKYYGTRKLDINGRSTEFMILEDVTEGMLEPCIIDIKIGRITSDPLALPGKIKKEQEKYKTSKDDVGFCIPGFQVYKTSTGRLHNYNKEYGKKLNGETIKDALRIYLNADNNHILCRELIVKLLSCLWKIQKWAKKQTCVRFFSTSLLIAYDCKKLKNIIKETSGEPSQSNIKTQRTRKVSFNSPETYSKDSTGHFSGQIAETGPILRLGSTTQPNVAFQASHSVGEGVSNWHRAFHKIHRSHSFHHNYSDFISKVKADYATTLKELIIDDKDQNKPWISVKIIDFAHTFPAEEPTVDKNYLEGLDSLIRIFESFLETAE
ncbi:inositol phosphate kinase 2 [Arctopsyche grandis]|uniref:inositol phosphate kinase 2 n=1 Tax=Arctopsyche grandis TaxID=121162 RepID=UPI00406D6D53